MKFIIAGGNNVKVLGRIINCLGRVGEDLYIESTENGMAFRTVNASRSAYACFTLSKNFFEAYNTAQDNGAIKCKLSIKAVLPIFKNINAIEKNVVKCKIHLDLQSDRLIFQFHCKHDIIKTYNLFFMECEILKAAYDKTNSVNCIVGETKLFSDAIQNFQWNQDEITFAVTCNKVVLRNYLDDVSDPSKVVHTEMSLEPEEFSTYNITQDSEVTFCLKELRAVLSFTDPSNYEISIFFESAGKPIVFSFMESPNSFETDFVLATISENQQTLQPQISNTTPVTIRGKGRGRGRGKSRKCVPKKPASNLSKSSSSVNISNYMLSKPSTSSGRSDRTMLGTLEELSSGPDSPMTPPSKKVKMVKSVFMALLESPKVKERNYEVLASDSEEDG